MYRQSLEAEAMAIDPPAMPPTMDAHFIQRVGSLPIVTSVIGQLANIYQYSKESNRYVKYTLETAEAGVKTVTQTAMPVVNQLERPIAAIDSVACGQLNKLEEKYPIIAKPTDEVVGETKKMYETTLKPHVDTVTGVTQTSIEKVGAAKQYTVDTIGATKQYTIDTVNSVTNFTTNKVTGAKDYAYNTVAATASCGKVRLDAALETPTGQTVLSSVDHFLDKTDQYVDYYLPDQDNAEKSSEAVETAEADELVVVAGTKPTDVTFGKLSCVSGKVRRRMYAKSMRDLQNVQRRSKETLQRLNFTVDLIEYAKSNLDGAKTKVSSAQTKFLDIWEEINREDGEEIEMSNLATKNADAGEGEAASVDGQQVTNAYSHYQTLEVRAIATARHLTSKLKKSFNAIIATSGAYLPDGLQNQIAAAKTFTENLYGSFTSAKTVDDVPMTLLTQTRVQLSQFQETLTSYTEYIRTNYFASWPGSNISEDDVAENGDVETSEKMDTESAPQIVEGKADKPVPVEVKADKPVPVEVKANKPVPVEGKKAGKPVPQSVVEEKPK